ncbi:MAG: DUF6273 domain-containing protein [Lachnospiraceae bacterium]|nr:DUF6273 domain-containing protein [Lachnospiraceae bacterium]
MIIVSDILKQPGKEEYRKAELQMGKKMRKTVKSTICAILSLFMIVSVIQINTVTSKAAGNVVNVFDDVEAGKWYVEAVQFVYDRGIMAGTSSHVFGVNQALQREQFAQILYSMAGKPAVSASASNPFRDVPNTPGYPRDAILWAYQNGIASGNGNNTFGVGQAIQRQAVASMLYKFAVKFKYNLTTDSKAIDGFADKGSVASWALAPMKWAVTQGVISGKGGNKIDPTGNATRAECAAMIMQLVTRNEVPKVGDIIKFGKYEQDGNTKNGKEAIEWVVLKVDGKRVFVVSKYALDFQPYDKNSNGVTWETCSLRKWMNDDFKNAAFSSVEQKRIPTVTVKNETNTYYNTPGGKDTKDKIFLLSTSEVKKYIGYNSYDNNFQTGYSQKAIVAPTKYAQKKGALAYTITQHDYDNFLKKRGYKSDVVGSVGTLWWLRTPGYDNNRACSVGETGSAGMGYGSAANGGLRSIRPAMYIDY